MEKIWVVKKEMPLFDFLLQYSGINKKALKTSLNKGTVVVDGEVIKQADYRLTSGMQIKIEVQETKYHAPFEILYEDDKLIAINKPSGLLSVSAGLEKEKTAYHLVREYLRQKNPQTKVFVVHRLDRDTSGVLLLAKNPTIQKKLQDKWNELVKERGYVALVEGNMEKQSGTLKHYLSESKTQQVYVSNAKQGKLAITHYRVIQELPKTSLLEIFLDTGKKNQIRVQMAHIHHALVGDKKYNSSLSRGRLCLHAHRLSFVDPDTNKLVIIEAKMPDFLGKSSKKDHY